MEKKPSVPREGTEHLQRAFRNPLEEGPLPRRTCPRCGDSEKIRVTSAGECLRFICDGCGQEWQGGVAGVSASAAISKRGSLPGSDRLDWPGFRREES